jgi:hypothetical protein
MPSQLFLSFISRLFPILPLVQQHSRYYFFSDEAWFHHYALVNFYNPQKCKLHPIKFGIWVPMLIIVPISFDKDSSR